MNVVTRRIGGGEELGGDCLKSCKNCLHGGDNFQNVEKICRIEWEIFKAGNERPSRRLCSEWQPAMLVDHETLPGRKKQKKDELDYMEGRKWVRI